MGGSEPQRKGGIPFDDDRHGNKEAVRAIRTLEVEKTACFKNALTCVVGMNEAEVDTARSSLDPRGDDVGCRRDGSAEGASTGRPWEVRCTTLSIGLPMLSQ